MTYNKEYWKKYYEKNKEKILNKNRAWAHSPQATQARHAKLLATKPDKLCKVCGEPIDKLSKKRFFCSLVCCRRDAQTQYRIRIKQEAGEKYQRNLAYFRDYYHRRHRPIVP